MIEINSQFGRISLGSLNIGWWNSEPFPVDPFFGWCTISWNDWNLELGEIDQDCPGIYITRYDQGEVVRVRTLLELR